MDEDTSRTKAQIIKKREKKFGPLNFIAITVVAVLLPYAVGVLIVIVARQLGVSKDFLDSNDFNSIFAIIAEIIYFLVVFWCVGHHLVDWLKLGYQKVRPPWRFIIYLIAGIGWYVLLSAAFSLIVERIFPGFKANQQQNLGIQNLHGWWQYVLAYVSLAIVPPIAEETLFRGFLFRGLRQKWPFWLSAIVTSLMFALAHGQLNVGIDVFALSLVLCFIVEKTDSIFIGMGIHCLKNTLAFVVLFTPLFPMLH